MARNNRLVLQGSLIYSRGIIAPRQTFGTGLPAFRGRDKCAAFGQGFGEQSFVTVMAADLPGWPRPQNGFLASGLSCSSLAKAERRMMPAPGLNGFGGHWPARRGSGAVMLAAPCRLVGRGSSGTQAPLSACALFSRSPLKSYRSRNYSGFLPETPIPSPEIILMRAALYRAQKQGPYVKQRAASKAAVSVTIRRLAQIFSMAALPARGRRPGCDAGPLWNTDVRETGRCGAAAKEPSAGRLRFCLTTMESATPKRLDAGEQWRRTDRHPCQPPCCKQRQPGVRVLAADLSCAGRL